MPPPSSTAAPPIRRVVLYKHGVAYLERRGQVEGAAALHLDVKARDLNDVLKSLTVLDLSGGAVSTVSYDSVKPLDKLLEEATIRIPPDGSLTALLGQVKGARVRLRAGGEPLEGVLVGQEVLQVAHGEAVVQRPFVTLLVDGALRTVDVLEVRELTFLDEAVRRDLEHYLATVLSTYRKDVRRLAILTQGEGRRELFVSYGVEAPVWKTSYRILLPGTATGAATATATGAAEPPLLQGWAVVDNTGDEDWRDVELALVSGLPVSFVHDLSTPRYLKRPEVRVQTEAAAAPIIPEEAFGAADTVAAQLDEGMAAMAAPGARAKRMQAALPTAGMPMAAMAAPPPMPSRREAMARSAEVRTVTREVGDLFEYRVDRPVTVLRNQSALVPILQRPFEGRRVLLWNRATRERNPMACIELTNSTGLTLEGGPVTVTEGDSYVGEAMLDTMKPRDTRLVPYAVELGCVVSVDDRTDTGDVQRVRVSRGVLVAEFFHVRTTHYRLRLKGARPATLVLEHPRTPWELVDTPPPAETTESHHRFRLELPAGGETVFTVRERSPGTRQWQLASVGPDDVGFFLRSRFIDPRVASVLEEVLALKGRIAAAEAQAQRLEEEREALGEDQQRLRANLDSLRNAPGQRELSDRFVQKLGAQEDRLEATGRELARLHEEQDALEAQVEARLQQLAFTKDLGEHR
jgi:hypothetical protein